MPPGTQTKPETSFIPKKQKSQKKQKRGQASQFAVLASIIVFLVSGAIAGGAFLYQQYLERSINQKEASLERAREAFEPQLLHELRRVNTRTKAARTLLQKHIAPSALFSELEERTLRSVRFQKFTYAIENTEGQEVIKLNMSGEAESFESIALQYQSFEKSAMLQEPMFSNFQLNDKGNVIFEFTVKVNKTKLQYANVYSGAGSQPATSTSSFDQENTVSTTSSDTTQ